MKVTKIIYLLVIILMLQNQWILTCTSDIKECELGISKCNQTCINTVGSYYCECEAGYSLTNDSHTCIGKLP